MRLRSAHGRRPHCRLAEDQSMGGQVVDGRQMGVIARVSCAYLFVLGLVVGTRLQQRWAPTAEVPPAT